MKLRAGELIINCLKAFNSTKRDKLAIVIYAKSEKTAMRSAAIRLLYISSRQNSFLLWKRDDSYSSHENIGQNLFSYTRITFRRRDVRRKKQVS